MRGFFIFFLLFSTLGFSQEKNDSIKTWGFNGRMTFLFNQSSFSNWSAGGDNTIAGNISVNYDFNYKKDSWNWDNKIITVYGSSHIGGKGYRKTSDRFEYNSVLGLKTREHYYFSFLSNFTTQYSKGFDYSKSPIEEVSTTLSPAYWSFGPGILWRKSDDIRINVAPATSRFTFVSDKFSGKYGVKEGRNSTYALGFSLSGYLKFVVMENVTMENIIAIYSDYLMKPQNVDLNYQMNYYVNVNKYLSVNVTIHGIIDDNASSRIQLKEIFGLGVNYTFHHI